MSADMHEPVEQSNTRSQSAAVLNRLGYGKLIINMSLCRIGRDKVDVKEMMLPPDPNQENSGAN